MLAPGAAEPLFAQAAPSGAVEILVGPEGGLSEREIDIAALVGFTALSLGPRVLRTETAPLAALAAMQALWGDFGR
jgi:16S rRNA (uracil1498-N3)-methyltransferase